MTFLIVDSFLALARNLFALAEESNSLFFFDWDEVEYIHILGFRGPLDGCTTRFCTARLSVLFLSVALFLKYGYSNLFGSFKGILDLGKWQQWCSRQMRIASENSSQLLQSKVAQLSSHKHQLLGTGVAQILFAHSMVLETLLVLDPSTVSTAGFWMLLIKLTSVYLVMDGLWQLAATEVGGSVALVKTFEAFKNAVSTVSTRGMSSLGECTTGSLFPLTSCHNTDCNGTREETGSGLNHIAFEGLLSLLDEDSHWLHYYSCGHSSPSPTCLSMPCSCKEGHEEVAALSGEVRRLEVAVVEKGLGAGAGFSALKAEAAIQRQLNFKHIRNSLFYLVLWLFNSVSFAGLGLRLVLVIGPSRDSLLPYWPSMPPHDVLQTCGIRSEHLGLALEAVMLLGAACFVRRRPK